METLKRRSDFKRLAETGKKFRVSDWLILNYNKNSVGHLRFGFTASKHVEKSVLRNKLKRWSKDYFKDHKGKSLDINLIFKKVKNDRFYKELKHEDFKKGLDFSLGKIKSHF